MIEFKRYKKVTPTLARLLTSAARMPEAFVIDGMRGKAGDYLVINEGSGWPVDCEIFEQTYAMVADENAEGNMLWEAPAPGGADE